MTKILIIFKTNMDISASNYKEQINLNDNQNINILIKLLMNNIIIEYISIDKIKKDIKQDEEYLYLKSKLNYVYETLISKLKDYYRKKIKKIRSIIIKLTNNNINNKNNIELIKMKTYFDMLYSSMQQEIQQIIKLKKKNIQNLFNECVNEKIVSKIEELNNNFSKNLKDFHIDYYKLNIEKYNNIENYINHIKNIWNIA